MVLNKISQLFLAEEVFAKMCHEIAHVRYISMCNQVKLFPNFTSMPFDYILIS